MTSLDFAASNGPEKTTPAVGMVPHLKRLIETLPGCVMRTDLEGCLLAANDSALQLLGVTEHAKVLTKSLTERISAEHAEDWRAFLRRSWSEGASSVECELVDFTGDQRFILFKSVAQPQHFDGTESLILTAQDLASRRRLERALNEHQGCAVTIDALRTELQLAEAEHQRLAAQPEGQHSSAVQSSTQDATNDSVKQQVADLKARLAAKEKEWQTRCDELTAQVAQHDSERQRMATLLDEQAGEHRRATETAA